MRFGRASTRELSGLNISELIVSKYVAESITMIAGRFGHKGLCQLLTEQFCTELTKAFLAKMSCKRICSRSVRLISTK